MELGPGTRWRSAVSDVEVVVVKAPGSDVSLQCGGHDMLPHGSHGAPVPMDPGLDGQVLVGKRFVHDGSGIEVLVTKGGHGTLCVDGARLEMKSAKPLPSSD